MENIPEIQITEEDKSEINASKNTLADFKSNAALVKEVGDQAAKMAGTDNAENLNNLLNNLGCKNI
jgi:hypothetical protein